jgi:REP element-mobilizing transposase RayT
MAASEGAAVYHCISRSVNGERLLDEAAREMLRKQMWQVAEFCGVEILTYALMSNHFHMLVQVPKLAAVSDAELLRRYKILHPKPNKYQTARVEVLEKLLAADDERGRAWRQQQLALIGDVSQFMKLLKQRFTKWFNRSHERYGTIWSERFKSVLVENGPALRTVAAYIDLNPVRAGMVSDPKDYRFCGYAEAVAGKQGLRSSLATVCGEKDWRAAHNYYRRLLYGAGGKAKNNAASLSATQVNKVIQEKGSLSAAELLRCRVRYFSDGAVLGSKEFIAEQLSRHCQRTGRRENSDPRPLPTVSGWEGLTTLRGLRRQAIG